jgi:nitrate/nitrite transporter NarK
LLLVCTFSEALFIPFLDNGNSYFSTVYSVTPQKAGTYLILPYCICALIVPIFGYFIDKIAKRAVVIVISCVAFLVTYGVMMTFERIDRQI